MSPLLTLKSAKIEIKPPGAKSFTTLTNDVRDDERAWPIGEVVTKWSRSTPWDHMDPTTTTFTLLLDPHSLEASLIEYDAQVKVSVHVTPTQWWLSPDFITIAFGWINAWERDPVGRDGRARWHIELTDVIGRAAATMLGDKPWPQEMVLTRFARINQLSAAGPLVDVSSYGLPNYLVGPRDVDNTSALQIIQEQFPIGSVSAISSENPDKISAWDVGSFERPGQEYRVRLPASAIEDTGRRLDRTSFITEVGFETFFVEYIGKGDDERQTRTIKGSHPKMLTSSRIMFISDEMNMTARFSWGKDGLFTWARNQIDASTSPTVALPGEPRIFVDQEGEAERVDLLLDIGWRQGRLVEIIDPPDDLERAHVVEGGTITLHGTTLKLSISLIPASSLGIGPARWTDYNTVMNLLSDVFWRGTFADAKQHFDGRLTFKNFSVVSLIRMPSI